ncbi:hypothetical protein BJX96DRAFT_170539 [Aspergillus floccosus]
MSSPQHPYPLESPPRPIAIRREYIAAEETTLIVTNRAEPWHSLDYSVVLEGSTILTVCGQPWSLGHRKVFHDRSGLPLFELQCPWYNSSIMSLRLPGDTGREILSAKLRVAVQSPSAVVTFENAVGYGGNDTKSKTVSAGKAASPDFVKMEVHRLDFENIVQVVVMENCRVAYINRITDRGELTEGQRPPFRFRPKWRVTVIAVLVVIAGRRTGAVMESTN